MTPPVPEAAPITSAEARALVAAGALLLDVRTAHEYASGHLEGAVNIPAHELDARKGELGDKKRPIVVYCRVGARSASVVALMRSAGYDAYDVGAIGDY